MSQARSILGASDRNLLITNSACGAGEVTLQSYARLRSPGVFSEELLEKILRGVSTQKYAATVLQTANVVGVSPTAISCKLVDLTATKLKAFQERSPDAFKPFAIFLDHVHLLTAQVHPQGHEERLATPAPRRIMNRASQISGTWSVAA